MLCQVHGPSFVGIAVKVDLFADVIMYAQRGGGLRSRSFRLSQSGSVGLVGEVRFGWYNFLIGVPACSEMLSFCPILS